MLKLIGILLIIMSSTICGFVFSNRLKIRVLFLQETINFLNMLKTQLRYSPNDIYQLINSSCKYKYLELVLNNMNTKLPFALSWEKSVSIIPKSFGLTADDKNSLLSFGRDLGTTDTDGQINHIELYISVFQKLLQNALDDKTKKSRLYNCLGFFLGTSIALMIV